VARIGGQETVWKAETASDLGLLFQEALGTREMRLQETLAQVLEIETRQMVHSHLLDLLSRIHIPRMAGAAIEAEGETHGITIEGGVTKVIVILPDQEAHLAIESGKSNYGKIMNANENESLRSEGKTSFVKNETLEIWMIALEESRRHLNQTQGTQEGSYVLQ